MTLRVFVINDFVLYNEFTACKEEVRFFIVCLVFMNSCLYHLTIWDIVRYHLLASDIINIKKKVMLVFLYMSEANKHSRRDENQDRFF